MKAAHQGRDGTTVNKRAPNNVAVIHCQQWDHNQKKITVGQKCALSNNETNVTNFLLTLRILGGSEKAIRPEKNVDGLPEVDDSVYESLSQIAIDSSKIKAEKDDIFS